MPTPVAKLETARPRARFPHENSKSLPAGSNPSKRHRAGPGIIAPSDQEPSKGRSTGGLTRSPRSGHCEPRIGGNEHGQQRSESQGWCDSPNSVTEEKCNHRRGLVTSGLMNKQVAAKT